MNLKTHMHEFKRGSSDKPGLVSELNGQSSGQACALAQPRLLWVPPSLSSSFQCLLPASLPEIDRFLKQCCCFQSNYKDKRT